MLSRSLQDLVGDRVKRQTQLTSELHNRMNTYYASIEKVLSELELRFCGNEHEITCALGTLCHSEKSDKESFCRVDKF